MRFSQDPRCFLFGGEVFETWRWCNCELKMMHDTTSYYHLLHLTTKLLLTNNNYYDIPYNIPLTIQKCRTGQKHSHPTRTSSKCCSSATPGEPFFTSIPITHTHTPWSIHRLPTSTDAYKAYQILHHQPEGYLPSLVQCCFFKCRPQEKLRMTSMWSPNSSRG